jgi:hypothetical protein
VLQLVGDHPDITYFSNKADKKQWLQNPSLRTKLLFAIGENSAEVHAAYLKLLDATKLFSLCGIHIGVALPGTHKKCELIVQYELKNVCYTLDRISMVFQVITSTILSSALALTSYLNSAACCRSGWWVCFTTVLLFLTSK